MANDGILVKIVDRKIAKPGKGQGISYAMPEKQNYGKLLPEQLRPLIERDVEAFLKTGGKITVIPPGVQTLLEDNN